MKHSVRIQSLTCLVLYATCAQAIMVKFGTKDGPIEPPPAPTPAPPVPLPYRVPAPVWETRTNDAPDPNAQWRPQLFIPQPRYTHIAYNVPSSTQEPINNAQRFANSYIPRGQPIQPIQLQPVTDYFTPAQMLSSQNLPGFGIRYFKPVYLTDWPGKSVKQDDAKHNQIETNEVFDSKRESDSDAQWKYEKEASARIVGNSRATSQPYVYQWPAYVPHQSH